MHTKTRASAVKIYLFFLFISLFAVSGCGLDIDFGGGTGNDDDVEENEVIMGFIKEIPDIDRNSNLIVRASVVKDETVACCEDTTSIGNDFYIEGNLDPKAELEILESGNENPPLGTLTVPVFPGATVDIQDISIENGVTNYGYINVDFEGQVDSKNCFSETSKTGSIKVTISSEGSETEVAVNLTSGTNIERDDERNLPCEEIVEGRKIRVHKGELLIGNTVDAEEIEIL